MRCGSADTLLVIIRGNSASGKSTVAAALREQFGRGLAVVGLTDQFSAHWRRGLVFHVVDMFMT